MTVSSGEGANTASLPVTRLPPVFWPKPAADSTATRGPVPHIASTTISRTGSTSDGTDAIVYRESALCGEPS